MQYFFIHYVHYYNITFQTRNIYYNSCDSRTITNADVINILRKSNTFYSIDLGKNKRDTYNQYGNKLIVTESN